MEIIAELVTDSAKVRKRLRPIAQQSVKRKATAADTDKDSVDSMY